MTPIGLVAEGPTDIAALRKLLETEGLQPGGVYLGDGGTKRGKHNLDARVANYAEAARRGTPIAILRDLDDDAPCAGDLVQKLVRNRPHLLFLRIAVVELEAWLVAERDAFAKHIGVSIGRLPREPERAGKIRPLILTDAAHSKIRDVRVGFPPTESSGLPFGSEYISYMTRFIQDVWTPSRAAENAPSLARALLRLRDYRLRVEGS
jgi:hypothetical protein